MGTSNQFIISNMNNAQFYQKAERRLPRGLPRLAVRHAKYTLPPCYLIFKVAIKLSSGSIPPRRKPQLTENRKLSGLHDWELNGSTLKDSFYMNSKCFSLKGRNAEIQQNKELEKKCLQLLFQSWFSLFSTFHSKVG